MDDGAWINLKNRTPTTLDIYIDGLDEDYPYQRIISIRSNSVYGEVVEFISESGYISETSTVTFGPYPEFSWGVTVSFTATVAYYDEGSDSWLDYTLTNSFTTGEPFPDPDEPLDPFDWDTPKIAGERFNVNATEWNRLTEFINAGLAQMDYSPYPFTYVVTGEEFSARIVNEVTNQLYPYEEIFDHTWYSGQEILASEVNAWRDQANYKFIPS